MSAKIASRSNTGGQRKETSWIQAYTARHTTGKAALLIKLRLSKASAIMHPAQIAQCLGLDLSLPLKHG